MSSVHLFLDIVCDRGEGGLHPEGHWVSPPPTACLAGYQVQGTTGAAASWSFDNPGWKTPLSPRGVLSGMPSGFTDSQATSFRGGRKAETWECWEGGRNRAHGGGDERAAVAFHGNLLILVNSLCSIKLLALERGCALCCVPWRGRVARLPEVGLEETGHEVCRSWWAFIFFFFTSSDNMLTI